MGTSKRPRRPLLWVRDHPLRYFCRDPPRVKLTALFLDTLPKLMVGLCIGFGVGKQFGWW